MHDRSPPGSAAGADAPAPGVLTTLRRLGRRDAWRSPLVIAAGAWFVMWVATGALGSRILGDTTPVAWVVGYFTYDGTSWLLLAAAISRVVREPVTRASQYARVLPVVLALAMVRLGLVVSIFAHFYPADEPRPLSAILLVVPSNCTMAFGWFVIVQATRLHAWQMAQARAAAMLQFQAVDAQLRTVQAALQPRFLVRTLRSVAVRMRDSVPSADRMLAQLGALLRLTLASSNRELSTLAEEVAFARLLLGLERERSAAAFDFRCHLDDDAGRTSVPHRLLQPLVEDAIRRSRSTPGPERAVELRVLRAAGGDLRVEVTDTGLPAGDVREVSDHARRIAARTRVSPEAPEPTVLVSSDAAQGTRVVLRIPGAQLASMAPADPPAFPAPLIAPPRSAPVPTGPGGYARREAPRFAAFWVALALLQASATYLLSPTVGGRPTTLAGAVQGGALLFASWAVVGFPALLFARYVTLSRRTIAAHGLVLAATAALFLVAYWLGSGGRLPLVEIFSRYLGFALMTTFGIMALGQLHCILERALQTEMTASALKAQVSEARLRMLRMQLEPHFLFNALNAVSALMRTDVEAACRVIDQLASLLRRSLTRAGPGVVTLAEEIGFLKLYLGIEQVRYQDRLRVRFAVADEALGYPVPYLLFQPLVENAVRHGIVPHPHPADLTVQAAVDGDDRLTVEIRDSGVGLSAHATAGSTGLGLQITRARLTQQYGTDASLAITPLEQGTRVRVSIPRRTA